MIKQILVLMLTGSICGCASMKPVTQSKQTFTFDYSPKQTNKSGSVGMVISPLLVSPAFVRYGVAYQQIKVYPSGASVPQDHLCQ